jgi:MFS family permease
VAFVGLQLTAVATPVQMYDITGSSYWVGLVGLAGLVPLVLLGLYAGSISDAVDRRALLLVSSVLVWTVTGGLWLHAVLDVNSRWVLLGLVAGQSAGFALTTPTRQAIVPRLLPTGLVAAGNTLVYTASNAGLVLGPLAAGVVLAHGSFAAAYAIDAALFTVALWAAFRLPSLPPLRSAVRPGLRSVAEGVRFMARSPVVRSSLCLDLAVMVLSLPRALFPEVAEDRLGGAEAASWLYASLALGSVLAGVASGWIGRVRRHGVALVWAVVVWSVAVAAAGLSPWFWLMAAMLATAGAADLVSASYRQTILQTHAPDEMRGRMQGMFIVVVAGGPRLGDLRAGAAAAALGVTASWVTGGVAALAAVLLLAASSPALRRYRADEPVSPSSG